jgi:hypothetical protein
MNRGLVLKEYTSVYDLPMYRRSIVYPDQKIIVTEISI